MDLPTPLDTLLSKSLCMTFYGGGKIKMWIFLQEQCTLLVQTSWRCLIKSRESSCSFFPIASVARGVGVGVGGGGVGEEAGGKNPELYT